MLPSSQYPVTVAFSYTTLMQERWLILRVVITNTTRPCNDVCVLSVKLEGHETQAGVALPQLIKELANGLICA